MDQQEDLICLVLKKKGVLLQHIMRGLFSFVTMRHLIMSRLYNRLSV